MQRPVARMFPRTLLDEEVKSDGERKVFEALRRPAPGDWTPTTPRAGSPDPGEGAIDGEIDFVLAHPEQAIVCLEVKGGGIECRYGEWSACDGAPASARTRSAGPGPPLRARAQAPRPLGERTPVCSSTRSRSPTSPSTSWCWRPTRRRRSSIDRNGLQGLAAASRASSHTTVAPARSGCPRAQGAEALRSLLAPDVRIEVPMASEFLDEEEALITLTHDQAMLLNRFGRDRRMVVSGCAGSGKTMLAVEQAKRLARNGKDVLFVCFNRALVTTCGPRGEIRGRVPNLPRALHPARPAGPGRASRASAGRRAAGVLG